MLSRSFLSGQTSETMQVDVDAPAMHPDDATNDIYRELSNGHE